MTKVTSVLIDSCLDASLYDLKANTRALHLAIRGLMAESKVIELEARDFEALYHLAGQVCEDAYGASSKLESIFEKQRMASAAE